MRDSGQQRNRLTEEDPLLCFSGDMTIQCWQQMSKITIFFESGWFYHTINNLQKPRKVVVVFLLHNKIKMAISNRQQSPNIHKAFFVFTSSQGSLCSVHAYFCQVAHSLGCLLFCHARVPGFASRAQLTLQSVSYVSLYQFPRASVTITTNRTA